MTKTIKRVKDPQLYKMIVTIAIPIACQNMLVFLTQMLDTIMLGELGDVPLTASSLANQVFNVYSLFIFGIAGGAAVLTAQYWGKKEMEPIKIVMGTVLRLVAVTGVVLSAVVLLFPRQIMMIFTPDKAVIEAGVEYMRIIGFMYFFFGMSNTLISLLRSIEMVKVAVIAKLAELCIVLIYVFIADKKLKLRFSELFQKDALLTQDLKRYCTPVVINEVAWSLGIAMQSLLFGWMSTTAVSANTIIGVVQQLATLFIFGVANATAVIIGKTIGEGDMELAQSRGRKMKVFAILMGIVSAVIIILFRDLMVDFYNVSEETKALAKQMLWITALIVFFISNSGVSIVGILRGGGDTKFSMMLEIVSLWLVAVPLGFIAGIVLKLPVLVVYFLFKSDEIVKTFVCWKRIAGDKWLRNVTR
jgi:Na+-driven multidrug efflux pump